MSPDDWIAAQAGMGTCFHQALHRWAIARRHGSVWKIAIGIAASEADPLPHLHAWLEIVGFDKVMASSTGTICNKGEFYDFVGIDKRSVRLVNPRRVMRAAKGAINKRTIEALLNESGIRWRSVDGGVLPA